MNKNILIIKLIATLASIIIIFGCSNYPENNINIQLENDLIVIHNDAWKNNIKVNACDVDKFDQVPYVIDSTNDKLYVYSPCCYLRNIDVKTGNTIDSIRTDCFTGERNFIINLYNDLVVLSSDQRIWLYNKDNLELITSLIDTIHEYTPIKGEILYSFYPIVQNNRLIVDLTYKNYNADSTFNYQIVFNGSLDLSTNPNFVKAPESDYTIPKVEDIVR